MNNSDLELNEEEIEYIVLKFITEQIKSGKKYVMSSEIYEYLGAEMPEDHENEKVVLSPTAKTFIKNYEAKHRPYIN